MAARNNGRSDNRQRLMEIVEVVRRHEITKGITPDKLCAIIEELGPTFIKLGQILSMRSDILPKAYCEALTRLRSDVAPIPFEQVKNQIENAYGRPLRRSFRRSTSRRWAAPPLRRLTPPRCRPAKKWW